VLVAAAEGYPFATSAGILAVITAVGLVLAVLLPRQPGSAPA
jgi:hypothetical protein